MNFKLSGCIPFVKETGLLDAENGVDIILIERRYDRLQTLA